MLEKLCVSCDKSDAINEEHSHYSDNPPPAKLHPSPLGNCAILNDILIQVYSTYGIFFFQRNLDIPAIPLPPTPTL